MIKKIALFLVVLLLLAECAYPAFSCDEKEITAINKKVNIIYNAVPKIEPISKDVSETVKLNAYYKDGSLIEMDIVTKSASNKQKAEYYFEKGFLILVIEKNFDINDNEMYQWSGIIHYYFKDNEMICWLNNDDTPAPVDDTYRAMENKWLDYTEKYLFMIQ